MQKNITNNTVKWEASGEYPVQFIDDAFGEGNENLIALIRQITGQDAPRLLIIADSNVVQRTADLGKKIGSFITKYSLSLATDPIILQGGEKIKSGSLDNAINILNTAIEAKLGKDDLAIVIGGGSVIDVACWACAQIRGGVKTLRMPTTNAAMIDSALSPCACINTVNVKDAIKLPAHPAGVVIDTTYLASLLDGVWRGGLSEIIRIAPCADSALVRTVAKNAKALYDRNLDVAIPIIKSALGCRIKNGPSPFALWSALRLEAMSGYRLPHGYAVAIGICIVCAYGVHTNKMTSAAQELVCRALSDCGSLECLSHSGHLLSQTDKILFGLDAWKLTTGDSQIAIPTGVGKPAVFCQPDRESFALILKDFMKANQEE